MTRKDGSVTPAQWAHLPWAAAWLLPRDQSLGQASPRWVIHREMSTASLLGLEATLDCRDEWQRAMDNMSDLDLDSDGDPALAAGLCRKRPDGFAINRGSKTILILELTRAFDSRATGTILSISTKQINAINASPK